MRIALVTEGTYPVHTGGVSTWCHQLVRGMPEHEWTVVALTATSSEQPKYPQAESVRRIVLHPLWERLPRPPRRRRREPDWRVELDLALRMLWDSALAPDGEAAVHQARSALERFVRLADRYPLAALLASGRSTRVLLDAWQPWSAGDHAELPPLSVADAVAAAGLVDRTLIALDAPLGPVDLVHAAGNGPAALVGLAELWRNGTPLVVSEHGVFLRERYLALDDGARTWAQRRAVTGVIRRICEVVYREADRILPVSDFNRRWEERLGAEPKKVITIHNGVQPDLFEPVGPEPEVPTLSWVGRIDPLKDLHTLVRAFRLVRERIPEARLRLFGPVPDGNEAYRLSVEMLVDELGAGDAVTFEGPSPGSRPAIAAGSVVVLSSISEGLPFTVLEAMMCGRPTVSTDVGGVAECLDPERRAGLVVPSRDPEAFAAACVELLADPERRRAMAEAARWHALGTATLDRCLDEYRAVYAAPRSDWSPGLEELNVVVETPVIPSPRAPVLVGVGG